jgi:hypothetical protein
MNEKVRQSWEEFLNPDMLRPRIISASIYIAAFEILKDAIVCCIRDFYSIGFDEAGDLIDPRYESEVLRRNRSQLHASLDWLQEHGAIDEADLVKFDRIKNCRNQLAHNLFSILAAEGMPSDFDSTLQQMVALLHKIELWWITEVEIPTNPDFDEKDVDVAGIVPGRIMGLQWMCDIALGDEKKSRHYYELFKQLSTSSST